jgi:hypothetical protein
MLEIFGKNYYIDIEGITSKCQIQDSVKKEEDSPESFEINIFKYETVKMCLDRILNEYIEMDEQITPFIQNEVSVSFKIAFNTLIKYKILLEEDEYE